MIITYDPPAGQKYLGPLVFNTPRFARLFEIATQSDFEIEDSRALKIFSSITIRPFEALHTGRPEFTALGATANFQHIDLARVVG